MSTRRVLVVEDEPGSCWALAELLRDDGYHVMTASDAAEALRELEVFDADVVIADLRLPGMSGLELIELVHRRRADCRLVLTSVYTRPELGRALPFDFLPKPIDPTQLRTLLDLPERPAA